MMQKIEYNKTQWKKQKQNVFLNQTTALQNITHQWQNMKQNIDLIQESKSVSQKYRAIKNTINLMNSSSAISVQGRNNSIYGDNQKIYQSQEAYFRLLNRMCEGQENYQLYKKEENLQMPTKTNKILVKSSSKSALEIKSMRKHDRKKQIELENQQKKKFLILPNFNSLLEGCVVGYANLTTQASLKRKVKKFKQNLAKSKWGSRYQNKTQTHWHEQNIKKNSGLKSDIQQLKKKAKMLYSLQFDDFDFKPKNYEQIVGQSNNNKVQQQIASLFISQQPQPKPKPQTSAHTRLRYQLKQKEKSRSKQNNKEDSNKQFDKLGLKQNTDIPECLLNTKKKYRPYSVSFVIKANQHKSQYYRV